MTTVIDAPGIYELDEQEYHADPVPAGSLSSGGAKKLMVCPALYRHHADYGQPAKAAFDFGHAAHKLVLGVGLDLAVIDAPDFRTNAARALRDEAYAEGRVPLLVEDYETVKAMAAAILLHPMAAALLNGTQGVAERSLFWVDPEYVVWRRARIDWLRNNAPGRTLLIDYKTCTSASPDAISKAVANYGYHQQAAWYLDGVEALNAGTDPAFVFIFQEKTAPYLVTVGQLDDYAIRIGRDMNRRAIERFRDCQASGIWPGYSTEVEQISLPRWAERQWAESLEV